MSIRCSSQLIIRNIQDASNGEERKNLLLNSYVGIKEPFKFHTDLFSLEISEISLKQINMDLLKRTKLIKINMLKAINMWSI